MLFKNKKSGKLPIEIPSSLLQNKALFLFMSTFKSKSFPVYKKAAFNDLNFIHKILVVVN